MTTRFLVGSTVISDNDEQYREAIRCYTATLEGMGLVQVEFPGQIDPDTVLKPTIQNTISGYQMWRFNDALQSGAPIFLKIGYGIGNTSNIRIYVEVGFEINESGGFVGLTTGNKLTGAASSYATGEWQLSGCHVDGFAGIAAFNPSYTSGFSSMGGFFICRTSDSDGVATAEGATLILQDGGSSSNPKSVGIRFQPSKAIVFDKASSPHDYMLNPFRLSSAVEGELPAYLMFHAIPQIIPMHGICGCLGGSLSPRDTFNVAMVGNAPRRYIFPGRNAIAYTGNNSEPVHLAMLWE